MADNDLLKIVAATVILTAVFVFAGVWFLGIVTYLFVGWGPIIAAVIALVIIFAAFFNRKKHWLITSIFWAALLGTLISAALLYIILVPWLQGSPPSFAAPKTSILIVGAPSPELVQVLDQEQFFSYKKMTVQEVSANPVGEFSKYDIIIVDQDSDVTKAVPKNVGTALQTFVKTGGKAIIVRDSGIKRPDIFDVIGWKNTFGDIMPVDCDRVFNNMPSCTNMIVVRGKITGEITTHPILQGVSVYPVNGDATFETFDVSVIGDEIAYIKSSGIDGKTYPAIVEKQLPMGKLIYFNYNLGLTKQIFENTLAYLNQ